jgi:alkanesulfonate monooxygenase
VIAPTRQEARDKWERMQDLIDPEHGVAALSDYAGIDLSKYPIDGPLPDAPPTNTQQGRQQVIYELARREDLTIRELYKRVAGVRAHRILIGTAKDAADGLEEWFAGAACDGFNILPLTFQAGLMDIVDGLLPELRRRGLFRTEYEGATLRENLGLPFPENRHARRAAPARQPSAAAR